MSQVVLTAPETKTKIVLIVPQLRLLTNKQGSIGRGETKRPHSAQRCPCQEGTNTKIVLVLEGGFFEARLRPSDRATERSSDRLSERSRDRAIERVIERSSERSSDRESVRASIRLLKSCVRSQDSKDYWYSHPRRKYSLTAPRRSPWSRDRRKHIRDLLNLGMWPGSFFNALGFLGIPWLKVSIV